MAVNGNAIAVGAYQEDGGPGDPQSNAGAVYIYERNLGGPGNWGQLWKRTSSDIQANDQFGWAVAISGNTLVVGSRGEAGGPGDPIFAAGAVYIFERNLGGPGTWGQATKLNSGEPQDFDNGYSVSIEGNTLVIGAYLEDGGPGDPLPGAGAAYVFQRNPFVFIFWTQTAKLTAGDAQSDDQFGGAVDISGDRILVGAAWEDGGPGDPMVQAGGAHVFERSLGGPGNWGEAAKLTPSDAAAGERFGSSVAIAGTTLAVGEPLDSRFGVENSNEGAAYVFQAATVFLPIIIR